MSANINRALDKVIADVNKSITEITATPKTVKFLGKDVSKVANQFRDLIQTIKEVLGGSTRAAASTKKLEHQFVHLKKSLNEERKVLLKNQGKENFHTADLVLESLIATKADEILSLFKTLKSQMKEKEIKNFANFDENLQALRDECQTYIKIDTRVIGKSPGRVPKGELKRLEKALVNLIPKEIVKTRYLELNAARRNTLARSLEKHAKQFTPQQQAKILNEINRFIKEENDLKNK